MADERLVRREELGGIALVVHRGHLAPLRPAAERGVVLDGEAVEREVVGRQRECAAARSRSQSRPRAAGRPKIRSSDRSPMPAARTASTAGATCSAVWVRCIHRRTDGSNDCTPSDTRFTPAARQAAAAAGVTSSGLASSVTSAPAAMARARARPPIRSGDGAGLEAGRRSAAEVDRVHARRRRPRLDGTATPAIPAAPRPRTAATGPRGGPRSRNRSSCSAGRRTGRGCRGARVKYARDEGGLAADAALFRGSPPLTVRTPGTATPGETIGQAPAPPRRAAPAGTALPAAHRPVARRARRERRGAWARHPAARRLRARSLVSVSGSRVGPVAAQAGSSANGASG